MIIELIITALVSVVMVVFSPLNLPNFPPEVEQSVDTYLDLIFNNLDFLSFFIRPETAKVVIVASISIISFKLVYDITMWILRKIPGLNIN